MPQLRVSDISIWLMRFLPFKKRFTQDEYKELYRILVNQTKIFRKRPQYIIGHVLLIGIVFYFVNSGFQSNPTDWNDIGIGMLIFFAGLCCVNSVKEHLCETLLELKKHPKRIESI